MPIISMDIPKKVINFQKSHISNRTSELAPEIPDEGTIWRLYDPLTSYLENPELEGFKLFAFNASASDSLPIRNRIGQDDRENICKKIKQ